MRGDERARDAVETSKELCISVVTYMELVQGMRNKRELAALRAAMRQRQAAMLYLDHDIPTRAAAHVGEHFLSQSLQLADALIGATAATHRLPLLTGDTRYYGVISDLQVQRFHPAEAG